MKNDKGLFCLGIACGIFISILTGFVAGHFNQSSSIQRELETNVVTNTNNIVLRNIFDLRKDIDGWYSFTADCYNAELGIPFKQYVRFNPDTKELVGYNVLKYLSNNKELKK